MKKNYIVFATLIFANVVAAQKIEGIAGFIQFGYLNTPNAELLNQFYPNNNSGFSNNYFSFGAEAFYRTNKNMIIGELQFGSQKVYSFNDEHAGAFYEAVLAKYGRIIKEAKGFSLYPSAGIGASVVSLKSYHEPEGTKEDGKMQTLVSPSFDLGMNSNFVLSKLRWKENYFVGWMMGIKAGYRFSIKSDNWKSNDENFDKISAAPSFSNNAFYVTLSFGVGSLQKK